MKFLLEFVTCCTSIPTEPQPPPEEIKYLVLQEPRRRVPRKHWRVKPGHRHEWRPSLTSISEDALTVVEKVDNVDRPERRRRWRWRGSIKRKIASISQRDRSRSVDRKECRSSTPLSTLMLSPTPFMF